MIAVKQNKPIEFSEATMKRAAEIIERYPEGKTKSAVLPLLHLAQEEFDGWLSVDAMDYVARMLHIQPVEVYEVASFYSMYNLQPVGKYVIEFCHTGPCALRGAEDTLKYIERKLNIKVGETTKDGMFTLKTVECLGACGYAPMFQVGMNYYENLNDYHKVDEVLDGLREKFNK